MNFDKIFSLYGSSPPSSWEYKDTSRGEDDFRRTVLAQWEHQKLAIKVVRRICLYVPALY